MSEPEARSHHRRQRQRPDHRHEDQSSPASRESRNRPDDAAYQRSGIRQADRRNADRHDGARFLGALTRRRPSFSALPRYSVVRFSRYDGVVDHEARHGPRLGTGCEACSRITNQAQAPSKAAAPSQVGITVAQKCLRRRRSPSRPERWSKSRGNCTSSGGGETKPQRRGWLGTGQMMSSFLIAGGIAAEPAAAA